MRRRNFIAGLASTAASWPVAARAQQPDRMRLIGVLTRNGNDFTYRFPLIEAAVKSLPVRSCLIDGEAFVSNKDGLPVV